MKILSRSWGLALDLALNLVLTGHCPQMNGPKQGRPFGLPQLCLAACLPPDSVIKPTLAVKGPPELPLGIISNL